MKPTKENIASLKPGDKVKCRFSPATFVVRENRPGGAMLISYRTINLVVGYSDITSIVKAQQPL